MRKHKRRLRSLPWITAVLAAVTSTSVATEQHDLQSRKKLCQEFLENRKFYGREENPDLLYSLQQFEGPGKIRFEYDPKDKWKMNITINVSDRDVLSFVGDWGAAFASDGKRFYLAKFHSDTTGCALIAYELATGKELWKTEMSHQRPFAHSAYANRVRVSMCLDHQIDGETAGSTVIVTGMESYCDYVEILDSQTGEMLALKNYRTGFGRPKDSGGVKTKQPTNTSPSSPE